MMKTPGLAGQQNPYRVQARLSRPEGSMSLLVYRRHGTSGPRVVGKLVLRGYILHQGQRLDPLALIPLRIEKEASDLCTSCLPTEPPSKVVSREAAALPEESPPALRTILNGSAYRLTSPSLCNLVTPDLAHVLEQVFESFAWKHKFSADKPLAIELRRGYEAGDRGHGRGTAVDIQVVGGRGLLEWYSDSRRAYAQSQRIEDPDKRREFFRIAHGHNLGYQLYKALLQRGGWRHFNGVVQLFGPWTDKLGPWKRIRQSDSKPEQLALIAEQEHIFRAHKDHIHVAYG